jgi:hypothetical protein
MKTRNENGELDNLSAAIVDINHAVLEELLTLPGIGKSLAWRIIDARPYGAIEDLRAVKGVGGQLYERILPRLKVTQSLPPRVEIDEEGRTVVALPASLETPPVIQIPESLTGRSVQPEAEMSLSTEVSEIDLVALPKVTEVEPKPSKRGTEGFPDRTPQESNKNSKGRRPLRRRGVAFFVFILSILSLILATLLSLSILFRVNGTIQYAPAQKFYELDREVNGLTNQASSMDESINTINAKIEALEELRVQVSDLETLVISLEESLGSSLDEMEGKTTDLDLRSEELETAITELQTFINSGLAALETQQTLDREALGEIGTAIEMLETAVAEQTQLLGVMEDGNGQLRAVGVGTPPPEATQLASMPKIEPVEGTPVAEAITLKSPGAASLEVQIQILKVMQILSRGRLHLAQSNYGIARQDIETSREILLALQAQYADLEVLDGVVDRLTMTSQGLPESPLQARNDLETAWQILLEELPLDVAPVDIELDQDALDREEITRTPTPSLTSPAVLDNTITETPAQNPTP